MYKEIIRPILNKFDSETFHGLARESLHFAEISQLTLKLVELFADKHKRFADPRLRTHVGGVEFENPLIVGAGWDKAGRAVAGLWHLGFAGVEVGSVLEHPQPGNPKPRLYMVSNGTAINWLGFNSPGVDVVKRNLSKYKDHPARIGISIGMNRDVPHDDSPRAHAVIVEELCDEADYFAINISSPNTPGLRKLQEKGRTIDIVHAVKEAMERSGHIRPVFIKIAPDLTYEAVDDIIGVALEHSIAGIIASNTTINTDIKAKYGNKWRNSQGGLSGDDVDYRKMTTEMIAHIYRQAGDRLDIIGVGGVHDAESALEKIMAGAKALQLVTAIRGEGSAVAGKINRGIVEFLEKEKIDNMQELIGISSNT